MARGIRIGVSVAVLISAFAALLWSTLQEGAQYYKHVDEVVTELQQWDNKPLQLHGFVVPGSILVRPSTLEYKFQVQNQESVVSASYTGIVPDTFKDGAEVVLSGRFIDRNFEVSPNGVMAKCPSRYEDK